MIHNLDMYIFFWVSWILLWLLRELVCRSIAVYFELPLFTLDFQSDVETSVLATVSSGC